MAATLLAVAVVLAIAEAIALATGEVALFTISRVVWDATFATPLVPFAGGLVAGHFWFPKGKCVLCGFRPWAADAAARQAFDGALIRFARIYAREWGKTAGDEPDVRELKRKAGFPVEG